jgi:hypothetical protein
VNRLQKEDLQKASSWPMERIGSIFAVCLSAADQRQVPSLRATVFMPSNHLSPNGKIAKVPEEVLLKYRDDLHQTIKPTAPEPNRRLSRAFGRIGEWPTSYVSATPPGATDI